MKAFLPVLPLLILPSFAEDSAANQAALDENLAGQAHVVAEQANLVDRERQPIQPVVTELGEGRYRVGEFIEIDAASRTIEIPAQINLDGNTRQDGELATTPSQGQVLIEYLLAHNENGPVHEALCTTAAHAYDLQLALLLLSYRADDSILSAQTVDAQGNPLARDPLAEANRSESRPSVDDDASLQISLRWKADGETHEIPAYQGMINLNSGEAGEDTPFAFTGSSRRDNYFVAENSGTLISTFLVGAAVINPGDKTAVDDDIWVPNPAVLPERGTELRVIIGSGPSVDADDAPDAEAKSDSDSDSDSDTNSVDTRE